MRRTGLVLTFLLTVSACATNYQSKSFTGGFREQKLADDTYDVAFGGNSFTSADTVSLYLTYRCAELTLREGYDYFVKTSESNQIVMRDKPLSRVTIRMYKGERPSDPGALDAHQVIKNLGPQVRK